MANRRFSRARSIKKEDLKTQLDRKYRQVREFFDAVTEGMTPLEKASIAATPVPILGDVLGLSADMEMYFTDPESRTFFNVMMSGASLIPFVPPVSAAKTALDPKTIENVRENVRLFGDRRADIGESNLADVQPTDVDPRFSPRLLQGKVRPTEDQIRVGDLRATYESRNIPEPERISIFDLEGRPFITTMSDRTAAGGLLTGINDVMFDVPVNLRGGQDYMFDAMNSGQVWASDRRPVNQILGMAQGLYKDTGQSPLLLPWRMAPTGGDYATMTTEAMLNFGRQNMPSSVIKDANNQIRNVGRKITKKDANNKPYQVFVQAPEFKGIENLDSIEQLRELSGDQRKMIQEVLDKDFRKQGGLTVTESRIAVADPRQLTARQGGLQNIGQIDLSRPIIDVSGHPTYSSGIPGQGLGLLNEDIAVYQMLPDAMRERGILNPLAPSAEDMRALQMKPYGGIITEGLLRSLQDRGM